MTGRPSLAFAGALVAASALGACGEDGAASPGTPVATGAPLADNSSPAQRFLAGEAGDPAPPATHPVRLRIASISVDAPLEDLSLDGAGHLNPPTAPPDAGWYDGSSSPGAIGPAIIAGHVDSFTGPAVFARLRDLAPGASIQVTRSDGRTTAFRVLSVAQYPRNQFPTEAVYGPTPDRALRLITCGGTYDSGDGGYQDNVVAYAVATGP